MADRSLDMSANVPCAHSIAEAYLALLVTPCALCRHGACEPSLPPARVSPSGRLRFVTTCRNCGGAEEKLFDCPGEVGPLDPLSESAPLNPSPRPSRLIDVGQWLTLSEMMLESAGETPDAAEARWRKFRAAECLEEALKFYTTESELPPETAFFVESSRAAFRDSPRHFARQRLIALRAKLPAVDVASRLAARPGRPDEKRAWWKFW